MPVKPPQPAQKAKAPKRLSSPNDYEEAARQRGHTHVAGVDEAGRGPLAGPVVAAACLLPPSGYPEGLYDSKGLTAQERAEAFEELKAHPDVHFAVGIGSVELIDSINILQATMRAMLEAIKQLHFAPTWCLIDGLALPVDGEKIIKGDQKSVSIAAASIVAKETRDALMRELHESYPGYGFDQHKGYGTPQHREAIEQLGPCPAHRRSFEPVKSMMQPQLF